MPVTPTKPNCGPVALAAVLGKNVALIESAYAEEFGKGKKWRGRSNVHNLVALGRKRFNANLRGGRASGSLARFIEWSTKPNTNYLLRVGNHFVAYVNGKIIDQTGDDQLDVLSKKRVSHAYLVESK